MERAYVYTYDNAGNRTSKKTYNYSPAAATANFGTGQNTETYSYADNPEYEEWGDQLLEIINLVKMATAYMQYQQTSQKTFWRLT